MARGREAMTDQDWLADRFEAERPHLRAVAYRMLGSLAEADDAVQDAWVRLSRSDPRDIENLRAWLTTVVGRVCLNMLRSRRTRREAPLQTHVADPIVSPEAGMDPEQAALLSDSLGLALLAVLDTLAAPERVAFVLHDVFGVPFDEIAPIVGRSSAAARQLASRGRRRIRGAPVPDTDLASQWAVADAFWRPHGTATSSGCWPCSIRMSSSARTVGRRARSWSPSFEGRRPSPPRRCSSGASAIRRPESWSTEAPALSPGIRMGAHSRSFRSRSSPAGSARSISWPIRSGSRGWIWPSPRNPEAAGLDSSLAVSGFLGRSRRLPALCGGRAQRQGWIRGCRRRPRPGPAVVWTSSDGLAWSRVPADRMFDGARMRTVANVPGIGLVTAGEDLVGDVGAVWTSADGRHWRRAPINPDLGRPGIQVRMYAALAGGPGAVIVGTATEGMQYGESVVWTSSDGVTWTRGPWGAEFAGGELTAVTPWGSGLVAVGDRGSPDVYVASVWTSPPAWVH
jgi:RNA polymerase sigma factor (sigma-70 family)